jgi:OOP family OmpA-OmpF porin
MAKSIGLISADKDVFGRRTNLGNGFIEHTAPVAALQGRKALIIASDGEVNLGPDPVAEASKLLQANPDLCLHIISVADSKEGESTLASIAKLKNCTVVAKGETLLKDDAAMRAFAESVFYNQGYSQGKPAGAKMEDVIVLRGVNFAYNSDRIDATAQGVLNEVASAIKAKSGAQVQLNGYTDHFGTDQYNQALSQRRANAVKAYLVKQGIPANRMTAQGKGKSFTYDNKTEEGCYMNRRVEFLFAE